MEGMSVLYQSMSTPPCHPQSHHCQLSCLAVPDTIQQYSWEIQEYYWEIQKYSWEIQFIPMSTLPPFLIPPLSTVLFSSELCSAEQANKRKLDVLLRLPINQYNMYNKNIYIKPASNSTYLPALTPKLLNCKASSFSTEHHRNKSTISIATNTQYDSTHLIT